MGSMVLLVSSGLEAVLWGESSSIDDLMDESLGLATFGH